MLLIERTGEMAPVEFNTLVEAEILDVQLKHEIQDLQALKMSGEELDKAARIPIIDEFMQNRMEHFEQYLKDYEGKHELGYDKLNAVFRNTLKEAWG